MDTPPPMKVHLARPKKESELTNDTFLLPLRLRLFARLRQEFVSSLCALRG